jgi:hypothetical protein
MKYAKISFNMDPRIKYLFEEKYGHISDRLRELIVIDLFGSDVSKHPDYIRVNRVGKPSTHKLPRGVEPIVIPTPIPQQTEFPWMKDTQPLSKEEKYSKRMEEIEQEMAVPTLTGENGERVSIEDMLKEMENNSQPTPQGNG